MRKMRKFEAPGTQTRLALLKIKGEKEEMTKKKKKNIQNSKNA